MLPLTNVYFTTNNPQMQQLFDTAVRKCLNNLNTFAGDQVLVEGGGYEKIWLETQPMGGEMYAKHNVTAIATNMAGRGTDILLGGNPDFLARRAMRQEGIDEEIIDAATGHSEDVPDEVLEARAKYKALLADFKKGTDAEHERVLQTGGLHIIGTERHESRRIDNQLRGRAGRQGDPGSTQFFISLEDDLMRLFGSERIGVMVERLGLKDDEPLQAGLLTKQIESAQKRIEGRNFEARKHVLEYDNVMNRHREVIYGQRRRVLMGENVRENIIGMAAKLIDAAMARYAATDDGDDWDWQQLATFLENLCVHPGTIEAHKNMVIADEDKAGFIDLLKEDARAFYEERETLLSEIGVDMREFERVMLLGSVDRRWMDHIDAMDQLRDGIGFRAYSGKNPVTEYQIEAGYMFEELNNLIREDTVRRVYQAKVERTPERVQTAKPVEARLSDGPRQPRRVKASEKVGRNDPCPCGSGKKYKQCCGKDAE